MALLDDKLRIASGMVYQAAYALSIALPGKSRGKKKRAEFFAAKMEANAQRHVPAAIAIFLNCTIFLFLGTLIIREERGGGLESISLTVGPAGFFTETAAPEPPAGGGGGPTAALQEMLNEIPPATTIPTTQALPPELMASITTLAPRPITLPESTTRPIKFPALTAMASQTASEIGTGNITGTGNGQGSGSGTGSGTGTGTGNGADNSTSMGGGNANGTGAGTYSAGGNMLPKGERIWIITDSSGSMREQEIQKVAREIKRYDSSSHVEKAFYSMLFMTSDKIEEAVAKDYKVIVWITDLDDSTRTDLMFNPTGETPPRRKINIAPEPGSSRNAPTSLTREGAAELYAKMKTLLVEKGVKLFITSLRSEPSPQMLDLVEATGGSVSIVSGESKSR